jgi:16S rRNA U516 pseudouridylate synthase RsuA-like enzyme
VGSRPLKVLLASSSAYSLTYALTRSGVFKGALLHSSIETDVPYDSIAKQLDLNDTTTGRVPSLTYLLTHSITHSLTLLPLAVHRPGSMVPTSSVRLTVTEGKYRMVRRILHNAGHSVIALHRRRYGNHSITH